jgi:hypothetical protein
MIFIDNKYTRTYNRLVATRQQDPAKGKSDPKHHIIPRSMGGSDDPSNLVKLTEREHFIAHLLLTKMTTGLAQSKMIYAAQWMAKQGKIRVNSRTYERLREEHSRAFGETMKAYYADPETREKHSEKRKAYLAANPYTPETREKLSEKMKSYHAANPATPESREKKREKNKAYFAANPEAYKECSERTTAYFADNPEAREKQSKRLKAHYAASPLGPWWTDGISNTRQVECPGPEWVRGMTRKTKVSN